MTVRLPQDQPPVLLEAAGGHGGPWALMTRAVG
jgi:hypothetical protein